MMTSSPESLYSRIGGEFAVNSVVDCFYEDVLADERISEFFEGIFMDAQIGKLKSFLKLAFGGQTSHTLRSLREAHAPLVAQGLNDTHVDIIIEHLVKVMREIDLSEDTIKEAVSIVESYRDDVLCR